MRRMFRNQKANASQIPKVGNYQVSKSGGLRWSRQSLVLIGETTAVARSDKDCVSVTDIEPLSSDHTSAHSFVPLTLPTALHPVGPLGFTCTSGLSPILGGAL
jgi:hypothetical protein